jgi:hypothetical protein
MKPAQPAPMKSEDALLLIVVVGMGLTCLYLINEILLWQTIKVANHRGLIQARELYKKLHSAGKPIVLALRRRPPR